MFSGSNSKVSKFSQHQQFNVSGGTYIFNFQDVKGLKLCAFEQYVEGSNLYYYLVKGTEFTTGVLSFSQKGVYQYSPVLAGDYDYVIIPFSHSYRYLNDKMEYGQINAYFYEP